MVGAACSCAVLVAGVEQVEEEAGEATGGEACAERSESLMAHPSMGVGGLGERDVGRGLSHGTGSDVSLNSLFAQSCGGPAC